MITNIYLVRHAHSIYTPDELNRPLSEKGHRDAKRVTQILSDKKITQVISSNYLRAIQTVEGIANKFNLNIITDEGFKERILDNKPVENFDEVIFKYWNDFSFSLSGGESSYLAQVRGVLALKNVIHQYKGSNIVIGTHGNIMVLIMNYFDKKYDYIFWRELKMPDIYQLSFNNDNLVQLNHLWI